MHSTCTSPQTGRYSLVHISGRFAGSQLIDSFRGLDSGGIGIGSRPGVGDGVASGIGSLGSGHGANSQFGPVLPTALPSGHRRASMVQTTTSPPPIPVPSCQYSSVRSLTNCRAPKKPPTRIVPTMTTVRNFCIYMQYTPLPYPRNLWGSIAEQYLHVCVIISASNYGKQTGSKW